MTAEAPSETIAPVESTAVPETAGAYRWYALALLTAAQICHYIDRNVVAVAVEPIRREFGLSDAQVGVVGGLGYALAFALAGLPIGYLVDRTNRRRLLAAILVCWSSLTAAGGLAQSFGGLLLARMGVGAAEAGGSPTAMSILSDYFGPKERSTALGVWYLSAGIGTALMFVVGGYVVQAYGWREAFFIAGAPGIVVGMLVLFTLREPRRGQSEAQGADAAEPAPSPREALAYVLGRPAILHMMAGIVLTAAMTSAFALWAVSFFVRIHGLEIVQVAGWVAFGLSVPGAAISFLVAAGADRLAAARGGPAPERLALVSATTAACVVVVACAMALAPDAGLALGLMCAWCGLMMAHNGPANGLLVSLLKPRMRGTVVAGLQIMAAVMGFGFGPYVVGLLSDLYGGADSLRWAIVTGMAINAWAVIHFLAAARAVRRDRLRGR